RSPALPPARGKNPPREHLQLGQTKFSRYSSTCESTPFSRSWQWLWERNTGGSWIKFKSRPNVRPSKNLNFSLGYSLDGMGWRLIWPPARWPWGLQKGRKEDRHASEWRDGPPCL